MSVAACFSDIIRENHEVDKRLVCRETTFDCRKKFLFFFFSLPRLPACFKCLRENTIGAKRQNVTILNRRTAFVSFLYGEYTISLVPLVSVCCDGFLRLFISTRSGIIRPEQHLVHVKPSAGERDSVNGKQSQPAPTDSVCRCLLSAGGFAFPRLADWQESAKNVMFFCSSKSVVESCVEFMFVVEGQ